MELVISTLHLAPTIHILVIILSTDRSKAVILLLLNHVISVLCLLCFRARLFIDNGHSPSKIEIQPVEKNYI